MAGGSKKFSIVLVLFFLVRGFAQESGETGVLVYNSKMPASKDVADHYAEKRKVPATQIISLPLPTTETISRSEFETDFQIPLWKEMRARKLLVYREGSLGGTQRCNVVEAKVRYAVLCYGVPLKITPEPARTEEAAEKLQPELRRNEAAVDSELALLPFLDQKPPLVGFLTNPGYLATNRNSLNPTNGLLMVARIDGPSPELAKGLVDKALEAEKEGLWGRAYFDSRGMTNGPMKIGDDWIQGAADAARAYGFDVISEPSGRTFPPSAPLSDIAFYFGWYDQSVSGPFTNGMAQFRPGAVAYHLHSFSSRALRVNDVWWTGPLIAAGATATMGCTEEPYLQTTPQVNAFIARFLFLGFSFGEAAYSCQPFLSWQNTIIGDPLYRPFAKNQQERYNDLEARKDKNIEWSMLMWINVRLNQKASLDEIEKFYHDNPLSKTSAVLQEKLGDIYKARGKIFEALEAYRTALKLPLTPIQRLRVSLSAGPLLSSLVSAEDAYALYKDLLKDYPNYTDKRDIYERLAQTAMRLHKDEDAREFQRLAGEGNQQ